MRVRSQAGQALQSRAALSDFEILARFVTALISRASTPIALVEGDVTKLVRSLYEAMRWH